VRLTVFAESWQLEENGDTLHVGQAVDWWLTFHDASWWPQEPEAHVQRLRALGRPFDGPGMQKNRVPTELTASGAFLYWDAPRPADGDLELLGSIHRDVGVTTPDDFPSTHGVIRRLRMESYLYHLTARGWEPIDNSVTYDEVNQTYLPRACLTPEPGRPRWTGVLVDLQPDA
jgi:hypothetical protein